MRDGWQSVVRPVKWVISIVVVIQDMRNLVICGLWRIRQDNKFENDVTDVRVVKALDWPYLKRKIRLPSADILYGGPPRVAQR